MKFNIQILYYFTDEDGAYYWHIKSGTIQREPPSPAPPDTKHVTIRSVSINSDSVSITIRTTENDQSGTINSDWNILFCRMHINVFKKNLVKWKIIQYLSLVRKPQSSLANWSKASNPPLLGKIR